MNADASLSSSAAPASRRLLFGAVAGAGALHLTLTAFGLPGWICPMRAALGVPCPGCGLTRATVALLHGDWHQALAIHAFAPLALAAVAACTVAALLPDRLYERWVQQISRWEHRWRAGLLLLTAILIYWLLRFLLDERGFDS